MPRAGDEQDCSGCGERVLWCVPRGMADGRNERRARRGDALGWWETLATPFQRHHCHGADVSMHRIAGLLDLALATAEQNGQGPFSGPRALPPAPAAPVAPVRIPEAAVAPLPPLVMTESLMDHLEL